jgi:hypothetical protein
MIDSNNLRHWLEEKSQKRRNNRERKREEKREAEVLCRVQVVPSLQFRQRQCIVLIS